MPFIIQHPSGAAVMVRPSDGYIYGIKSAEALKAFRDQGFKVVAVDDKTWKEYHDPKARP